MVYQRAFTAFLYQAEIPCPESLFAGFLCELELHRDRRKIGVTYPAEQAYMGTGKNADLSGEPIMRMMESKGASDMKTLRYHITLTNEETRLMLRTSLPDFYRVLLYMHRGNFAPKRQTKLPHRAPERMPARHKIHLVCF